MSRPSSINLLPTEARDALHEWLRDAGITQTEATERLHALLEDIGWEEDKPSRHAVNRYDMKMREVGEKLRHSRQVAEVWVGKLGAAPQGQLGHLINETLRTLAFDLTLKLQDGELTDESLPGVIDQLKNLSLSVVRLERAASENVKREAEIEKRAREKALQEAANRLDNAAQERGLSAKDAKFWREQVLMGM